MPRLSVIIVSYNVQHRLRECLASVYASTGIDFEVIVVDNCSADGSADMVEREFPQAHLLRSPVNGGYAYANNRGLRFALEEGGAPPDYLLLLNCDTVVPPTAFADMVAFIEERPDVGAAGPKLVLSDGRLDLACRRSFPTPKVAFYRMAGLSRLFPRSRRFGRYNLTFLDPDQLAEVDSVVGAFMLVRRQVIEQVGLLDESFFLYGEDLDWAYRMKQRGWKVYYNPAVQVLHYKGESSRRESRRATQEFYRAMLIFYRKHHARDTFLPLHWLILAAIHLRAGLAKASELLRPPNLRQAS